MEDVTNLIIYELSFDYFAKRPGFEDGVWVWAVSCLSKY